MGPQGVVQENVGWSYGWFEQRNGRHSELPGQEKKSSYRLVNTLIPRRG